MTATDPRSSGPRVAVLADDLIWASRLETQLRAAGAQPRRAASLDGLDAALGEADAVVIDLTARAYDGIAAIERAASAGRPVIAVGQHDDHALRRRALAAGASRVYAYRKLFDDGPSTLARWLGQAKAAVP